MGNGEPVEIVFANGGKIIVLPSERCHWYSAEKPIFTVKEEEDQHQITVQVDHK